MAAPLLFGSFTADELEALDDNPVQIPGESKDTPPTSVSGGSILRAEAPEFTFGSFTPAQPPATTTTTAVKQEPATQPPPPQQQHKSNSEPQQQQQQQQQPQPQQQQQQPIQVPPQKQRPSGVEVASALLALTLTDPTTALVPRGLINRSNQCFMHSVLQALLGCPLFRSFLTQLRESTVELPADTCPLLCGMAQFASEFSEVDPAVLGSVSLLSPQRPAGKPMQAYGSGAVGSGTSTLSRNSNLQRNGGGGGGSTPASTSGKKLSKNARKRANKRARAAAAAAAAAAEAEKLNGNNSGGPSNGTRGDDDTDNNTATNTTNTGNDNSSSSGRNAGKDKHAEPATNDDAANNANNDSSSSNASAQSAGVGGLNTTPFEPVGVYALFPDFSGVAAQQSVYGGAVTGRTAGGYQHDAQEFLSVLLDGLHEELVAAGAGVSGVEQNDGDDFTEVKGNGKKATIRDREFVETHITRMFGGRLRSELSERSAQVSATLESFTSIPIDIRPRNVATVQDGLECFVSPEVLDDFRSETTRDTVVASKALSFQRLPRVLVLQLKRFEFGFAGPEKVDKFVEYTDTLTIRPHMMAAAYVAPTDLDRTYDLVGVIAHHGKFVGGGHYTSTVRQPDGSWLEFDDSKVYYVPKRDVLDQQAYLLMYTKRVL